MASWQGIQSHTVAGPRRPHTDFPVQPIGFLPSGLSPAAPGGTAFDPRKSDDGTLPPVEVNLPRVANGQTTRVSTAGKRKTQEILAADIREIIDAKA